MYTRKYDRFYQHYVPTNEDVLDVNFRAIISDLRGIISGTLSPRPWTDISSTWLTDDELPRNRGFYRQESVEKLEENIRRTILNKRQRQQVTQAKYRAKCQIRKMAHILMLTGMTEEDAVIKATALLSK